MYTYIYTAKAAPQRHADEDKAPATTSEPPRTRMEGPLMAPRAGGRISGPLHVGTAKDRKAWCRATATTTAELVTNKKRPRRSASASGQ